MSAHARTLLSHLHRLTAPAAADATLLTSWIEQRDQQAFAALMARHGPMVLGVCRRLLGDVHEAEDVFQATFVVLARQASRLRQPESLAGFLHTVAVRLARKARAAQRRRQRMQTHAELTEPIDPRPHPLDVLSGRELLALLDEEIARLPESYRLPLVLCLLQGRTVEEAARQLGWSIGSLRGRLARGRERLRQRLMRRGLDLSVGAIALLAPVAVPEKLLAESLRHLSGPVPAAVSALASGMMSAVKLKIIGLALVLVTAVGLGAGLSLRSTPEREKPVASVPVAPNPQAKDEPRRDRDGDPLPPGAIARLGTLRFRVPGEIFSLAFAPDGETVAAASERDLFLFDAVSGKRRRQLSLPDGSSGREISFAFSPDGKRLARSGVKRDGQRNKGTVFVWDLDGQGKRRDYDAEHAIWVGWSAEGELLALCLEKDGLWLRELASGRSRRFEFKERPRSASYAYDPCACTPAGKTLAVADRRNQVHIWDYASGRERCILHFENVFIRKQVLSPDGRLIATLTKERPPGGDDRVQLWDAVTGKLLRTMAKLGDDDTILFAPDGKSLARVRWHEVWFWDVTTGRESRRIENKIGFSPIAAFAPDGKLLVAAERNGSSIQIWDVESGRRKHQPAGHRCQPQGIAFAPDGRSVATGGRFDGTIHLWDVESGESLTRIQRPGHFVRDIAFSADGRSLFSTWTDDELWISGSIGGGTRHVLKLADPDRPDTSQSAISMYQSHDGKTLVALSCYETNEAPMNAMLITGWDAATRKQLFRRRRAGYDSRFALSSDARVLAVPQALPGDEPGQGPMLLEDAATGELLLTFPVLEGETLPLAFSPDDRLLASLNWTLKRKDKKDDRPATADSALRLWETATAAEVLTLPLESPYRVAFSPDGRLLALRACLRSRFSQ